MSDARVAVSENGEMTLPEFARNMTFEERLAHVQETVRRYIPDGSSLVDELIAARRVEASRETMNE